MEIKTNLFKKCFGKSKFLEVYGRMEVLDMATSTLENTFVLTSIETERLLKAMSEKHEALDFKKYAEMHERSREALKYFLSR